jgi:hypothetical protein
MRFSFIITALYVLGASAIPVAPASQQPTALQMSQALTKSMPFLKQLVANHAELGPILATRNPIFATPDNKPLDFPKVETAIAALAADPPAAKGSNIGSALSSAMAGDMSGAASSGAMALGMDLPYAIASGVGSVLSMEWSIISGIGGGLGSAASAGLGLLSGAPAA